MTIFKELIGKKINGIFLGNDNWSLVFRDTDGKFYRFDTSNDCCNTVWVNHLTGINCVTQNGDVFDLLRGAEVLGGEDKGWGENRSDEDDYDVVQDGFWTLKTNKGYIDIEVRNSHNGYYGGSFNFVGSDIEDIESLSEVKDDF